MGAAHERQPGCDAEAKYEATAAYAVGAEHRRRHPVALDDRRSCQRSLGSAPLRGGLALNRDAFALGVTAPGASAAGNARRDRMEGFADF
jgi:hypothetical protein